MKCIFFVPLFFALALASGGGYGIPSNGYGAVMPIYCKFLYFTGYGGYRHSTYQAVMQAAQEAQPRTFTSEGQEVTVNGLTNEDAVALADQAEAAGAPAEGEGVAPEAPARGRRNYTSSYRGARSYGGYNSKSYYAFKHLLFQRQLKCTCEEIISHNMDTCNVNYPYTVDIDPGKRSWQADYSDDGYGYAGAYRKKSGYGNKLNNYVIPESKSAVICVRYSIKCCKAAPAISYAGSSSYGSGGNWRKRSGRYNRCPAGTYLDYEVKTLCAETNVRRYYIYGHSCEVGTPSCAVDSYAGAALPHAMKYAYVPTGPDYETDTYGSGYGGAKYGGGSQYGGGGSQYGGGSNYGGSGSGGYRSASWRKDSGYQGQGSKSY